MINYQCLRPSVFCVVLSAYALRRLLGLSPDFALEGERALVRERKMFCRIQKGIETKIWPTGMILDGEILVGSLCRAPTIGEFSIMRNIGRMGRENKGSYLHDSL
jgi:hypothetical protein